MHNIIKYFIWGNLFVPYFNMSQFSFMHDNTLNPWSRDTFSIKSFGDKYKLYTKNIFRYFFDFLYIPVLILESSEEFMLHSKNIYFSKMQSNIVRTIGDMLIQKLGYAVYISCIWEFKVVEYEFFVIHKTIIYKLA